MDVSGDQENILGMNVAVITRSQAVDLVAEWIGTKEGRYVCVANVHMCMESVDCAEFRSEVNSSDLTVPDGLPLMWAQSLLGRPEATQVRGEDLTTDLFAFAEKRGVPIGIFGGTEALLLQLRRALRARFPRLEIAYLESPPFRTITEEEDRKHVAAINSSGARILFVGLGCPKQERWMAAHKDRLSVVMLGVGAAFDFIAGSKRAAPRWIQRIGLEWIFRLCNEPKRLWKRYLNHNPRFLWQFGKYFLAWKLTGARSCGPEK